MRFLTLSLLLCVLAPVALAEDAPKEFTIGGDSFRAGQTVSFSTPGTDDLFVAGQTVQVDADIAGNVHAVGQNVRLRAPVGGDVYVMGQDVTLSAGVGGDVTALGQAIILDKPVGSDLRAAGAAIAVNAPVGGYALLAGQSVTLNAEIAGDVNLSAEKVVFGGAAQIDGRLTLHEKNPGALSVPASVIPDDRITRVEVKEWEHGSWDLPVPSRRSLIGNFIGGVVLVALLAALIAALVPERLAHMRRMVLASPFRTLGIGFLTESALIGSIFLVAITLIGLVLVPAILLLAGLVSLAGYIIAAYAFGVGLILLIGRSEPDSLAERAVAAGIGALVAGLVGLLPILGWIFILALSLTGVGAIARMLFGSSSRAATMG